MVNILIATGAIALPFIDKSFEHIEDLILYPHPFIRHAAIRTCHRLLITLSEAYPLQQQPTKGVIIPLHQVQTENLDKVMPLLIERMADDSDRECAAVACEAITEIAKIYGLAGITKFNKDLYDATILILQEKAPCQNPEDDDDADFKDHDEMLMETVTDWIPAWASVLGNEFEKAFQEMLPLILNFCDSKRPDYDRSMAIGCIAETAMEMGGQCMASYIHKIFPHVINGLQQNISAIRRNSAFCAGEVAKHGGNGVQQYYPKVLSCLSENFNENKFKDEPNLQISEWYACRDNCISAIIKMQQVQPQLVPLEHALPMIFTALPLVTDQLEAKYVYPWLLSLYQTNLNQIQPFTIQLLNVFSQVFGNPEIEIDLQKQWMQYIKQIVQTMGPQVLQQMPQENRDKLIAYCQL